jgi:hypothetical protein
MRSCSVSQQLSRGRHRSRSLGRAEGHLSGRLAAAAHERAGPRPTRVGLLQAVHEVGQFDISGSVITVGAKMRVTPPKVFLTVISKGPDPSRPSTGCDAATARRGWNPPRPPARLGRIALRQHMVNDDLYGLLLPSEDHSTASKAFQYLSVVNRKLHGGGLPRGK